MSNADALRPFLARGAALHFAAWRHGDAIEKQLSRAGLSQIAQLAVRQGVVSVGRALDYLVAPQFRRVVPEKPVFVVAPPRSGTTLLYGLLACDPQFVGPRLYEALLPAVSLLAAVEKTSAFVNRVSRGSLASAFDRWELETFKDLDEVHRARYRELEEDTALFDRHFSCASALRFLPPAPGLLELVTLDTRQAHVREAVMETYYRAVQRVLYRARGRTYLAKNVASAGRIGSLLQRFPDARMIHIVRHPYQVIPSTIRLFQNSNYIGTKPDQRPELAADHPRWRVYGDFVIDAFSRLLRWERRLPEDSWLTLRFDDLVADPRHAVRQVYDRFGLQLSAGAEAAIAAEVTGAARHRSTGKPLTLEACGYDRRQVHDRLREVFEHYGLAA